MDKRLTSLPTDSAERKEYSLARGCYAYFPAALAGVARHSFKAGAKHTGGQLVHNRWKSDDAEDCVERHMMDIRDLEAHKARVIMTVAQEAEFAQTIMDEANALAWRAMEVSQKIHEKYGGAPLAPAARLTPEPPTQGISPAMRDKVEAPYLRASLRGLSAAEGAVPPELRGEGGGGLSATSDICRCNLVWLASWEREFDSRLGVKHTRDSCG